MQGGGLGLRGLVRIPAVVAAVAFPATSGLLPGDVQTWLE